MPQTHTSIATPVAITTARIAAGGIIVPSIAMLVKVAKMPPAGVKAPYMYDWKAAAIVPWFLISRRFTALLLMLFEGICMKGDRLPAPIPAGPKPKQSIRVQTAVNVMAQAMMIVRTSVMCTLSVIRWVMKMIKTHEVERATRRKNPAALTSESHYSSRKARVPWLIF